MPSFWKRLFPSAMDQCFDALVHRYGPMVFGLCRRVLRNSHDAEDAFQASGFIPRRTNAVSLRWDAVKALGSIGPDAKEGVPTLLAVLEYTDDGNLGDYTIITLGKIGPNASDSVPLLVQFFEGRRVGNLYSGKLKGDSVVALGQIGPTAKAAVPALLQSLRNMNVGNPGDDETLFHIVATLGQIGPDAKQAVPTLLELQDARSFAGLNAGQLARMHAAVGAALEKIQR